jgi:hypothetical protein
MFQAAKDLSLISIALKKEMKNKSDYESRWSKFYCFNFVPFRVHIREVTQCYSFTLLSFVKSCKIALFYLNVTDVLFHFRLQKELAQKARTIAELKATLEAQSREIKILTDTNKVMFFYSGFELYYK